MLFRIERSAGFDINRRQSDPAYCIPAGVLELRQLIDHGRLSRTHTGGMDGIYMIHHPHEDGDPIRFTALEFLHLQPEMLTLRVVGLFEKLDEGFHFRAHGLRRRACGGGRLRSLVMDGLPLSGGIGNAASEGFEVLDLIDRAGQSGGLLLPSRRTIIKQERQYP